MRLRVGILSVLFFSLLISKPTTVFGASVCQGMPNGSQCTLSGLMGKCEQVTEGNVTALKCNVCLNSANAGKACYFEGSPEAQGVCDSRDNACKIAISNGATTAVSNNGAGDYCGDGYYADPNSGICTPMPELSAALPGDSNPPAPGGSPYSPDIPTNTGLSAMSIKQILESFMFWLLGIVGILAVMAFLFSGTQYLLASGSEEMAEAAKRNMKFSLIGVVIAMAAMIIVRAIDSALKGISMF